MKLGIPVFNFDAIDAIDAIDAEPRTFNEGT